VKTSLHDDADALAQLRQIAAPMPLAPPFFEIKDATAAVLTSVFALVATFTAGTIYRHNSSRQLDLWNAPGSAKLFFLPWFGC
jgi:hypothetical protein